MSAPGTVHWTKDGKTGMTRQGSMITMSAKGFLVFDAEDRYVGTYATRADAEAAAR